MSDVSLINVFYSWQSDTNADCNRHGISTAATEAATTLQGKEPSLRIKIDEATRDMAGSPNIPEAIFSKISASDIFLCDITSINQGKEGRPTPNPNVLIELGYAIAMLGWKRIILVFNNTFGKFPDDVPFDIKHHRTIGYTINDKEDKNGRGNLKGVLTDAFKKIIEDAPPKPHSHGEERKIKRERDVKALKQLLSEIYIPLYNLFLEEAPMKLYTDILHYWSGFNELVLRSNFFLHDQELLNLIHKVRDAWELTLAFDMHYMHTKSDHVLKFDTSLPRSFGSDFDMLTYQEQAEYVRMQEQKKSKDLNTLRQAVIELRQLSKQFFEYVQSNYLEIDLEETSRAAYDGFKTLQDD